MEHNSEAPVYIHSEQDNIREFINKHGYYACMTYSMSMYPMLKHQKNPIYIVKPESRLKKYDIALYERENGSYVLHRVMQVYDDCYSMCGDNQTVFESGVTDDMIVGVLHSFYKKDREIVVSKSFLYKIYVMMWCSTLLLRKSVITLSKHLQAQKARKKEALSHKQDL